MPHPNNPPSALIIGNNETRKHVFSDSYIQSLEHDLKWLSPPINAEEFLEKLPLYQDLEIIFGTWGMPLLNKALLEQLPKLKAVFYAAGTVKYFISEAFWARNIQLSTAATANAIPVVEFTYAQIILCLKRFYFYQRWVKERETYPPIAELMQIQGCYGATIGIISLSRIGRMLIERLQDLNNIHILAYDPLVSEEEMISMGIEKRDLESLFKDSDLVSLHTPWLKETENMIHGHHIESMKPNSSFINTARGAIVCENELLKALKRRPDIEAVIDVTWPEPPAQSSPFYHLPNIQLSPHIAGSLGCECQRMANFMKEEFYRFLNGNNLKYKVTPSDCALMA